jgi:hypothetical protein
LTYFWTPEWSLMSYLVPLVPFGTSRCPKMKMKILSNVLTSLVFWHAIWRHLLFIINNLSFLVHFHVFLLFSCHLLSSNWFCSSMSLTLTKPLGHSQTTHSTNLDIYQGHLDFWVFDKLTSHLGMSFWDINWTTLLLNNHNDL